MKYVLYVGHLEHMELVVQPPRIYVGGRIPVEKLFKTAIDLEWAQLILDAKRMGLTIEEIREFLKRESTRKESATQ